MLWQYENQERQQGNRSLMYSYLNVEWKTRGLQQKMKIVEETSQYHRSYQEDLAHAEMYMG